MKLFVKPRRIHFFKTHMFIILFNLSGCQGHISIVYGAIPNATFHSMFKFYRPKVVNTQCTFSLQSQ